MSNDDTSIAATDFALDNTQVTSIASSWAAYKSRLRSGDLGALPSLLAITVLVLIFSLSTDSFLSLRNAQNFLEQAAPIAVIAMAVSFVLLVSSEFLIAKDGLGYLISGFGDGGVYEAMFACIITVVGMGFIADRLFQVFMRRMLAWRE